MAFSRADITSDAIGCHINYEGEHKYGRYCIDKYSTLLKKLCEKDNKVACNPLSKSYCIDHDSEMATTKHVKQVLAKCVMAIANLQIMKPTQKKKHKLV